MPELIERFISKMPNPTVMGREIAWDGPARQRKLIEIAHSQIRAQRETIKQIEESHLLNESMMIAEVHDQTEALSSSMEELGDKVLWGLQVAADTISHSVEKLGNRLCACLVEIQWELAQHQEILKGILQVLRENRRNEAQQLVAQAVRHYHSGELAEAEERLRRALDWDTTDYQVLMNLGFVEVQKGGVEAAHLFFKKALTLPTHLDPESKSRTLWAIARLYYTQQEFDKALKTASEAHMTEGGRNASGFYTVGVYAALAGQSDRALVEIEKAVLLDRVYFVRASSDPDLEGIRQDIFKLLSRLANSAMNSAQSKLGDIGKQLDELRHKDFASQYDDLIAMTSESATRARHFLETTSYSGCLDIIKDMQTLASQLAEISSLNGLYAIKSKAQASLETAKKQLVNDSARCVLQPEREVKQSRWWESFIVWLVLWSVPGFLVRSYVMGAGSNDIGTGPNAGFFGGLLGVIWPLPWVLGGIAWLARGLFGSHEKFWMIDLFYVATGGLFRAIILALAIWFSLRLVLIILPTRRQKKIAQDNAAKRDVLSQGQRKEAEAANAVAAADSAINSARGTILHKLRELSTSYGAITRI